MSKGIWGHLVVHNESVADVCRAIESIFPVCSPDPILVVHDGSTQPLIDWLEERKDIYNLRVFYNKFVTVREQRQFLLDQTPVNNWVVALDADECYSMAVTKELRNCLLNQLSQKHYETAKEGNVPLVISIPHINLVGDITHWDNSPIFHTQKIFYYEKGLHWTFADYFCHISYKKGELSFETDETTVYSIIGSKDWVLLHFARLSPDRLQWRAKHINDPKYGNYDSMAWEKEPPKIVELEQDKW